MEAQQQQDRARRSVGIFEGEIAVTGKHPQGAVEQQLRHANMIRFKP
jgi:hypothetical protein